MDKIYYVIDDKVQEDIKKLKTKNLYNKYLKIVKSISINPYNPPDVSKKHFGKIKCDCDNLYHIDINYTHRIFYTIDNNEIEINNIEFKGIIDIISAFGHNK